MTNQPKSKLSWFSKLTQLFISEPQDKEELVEILNEASDRAVLNTDSSKMMQGVLRVSEMRVGDIMIPRSQMVVLDSDMKIQVALPIITQSAHSRFPVIGESKDQVLGIMMAKDILALIETKNHESARIRDLTRPAVFIPESKKLDTLLEEFRTQRYHMAIVVDEYGCVSGLITIEDVLEQIVGDIEDEYDQADAAEGIEQTAMNTFTIKALTPIAEFNQQFSLQLPSEDYDTIGGYVLQLFGHMPKQGEMTSTDDFQIIVLSASKRRIELLEFIKLPTPIEGAS